ncbi:MULTISPECIES: DUF2726 domain-containing protein [unclassified Acinetobacter]|uniref:DUF2726 domain-containing protein n=1 Tax=unclassified Acinetobacter TaxID=196816 RepID=UPI0029347381|nr:MULTISPECIES: DUF2726 domain-containing protein [unclassified Acinetobacter]WOE31680.1 DUF2726 domain-containing protein [Acinetobacter sp. SAAs470]WOE37145.1 DUF2726 domain-containing protein [Acinetobacter sp. SAAs474]
MLFGTTVEFNIIPFCIGMTALVILFVISFKKESIFKPSKKIQPRSLLTKTEIKYFYMIRTILPSKYHLCPQVSFNAIITSKDIAIRNTFNRKYCDFTICDSNFKALAVIEIDDRSHNDLKVKQSDAYRDKILKEAGLLTIRFLDTATKYEVEKVIRNNF